MNINIFLLIIATLIVAINCGQTKSVGRERRYPTREPQGLFPDAKRGSLTRTYRSTKEGYRFDENKPDVEDPTIPRDDKFVETKLELLKKEEATRTMNMEENKRKALMTNDIDDDYDFQDLPKYRRRMK